MKEKYAKEPVFPDLQNKWQSGWRWPLKSVNHSNRLSRTRSCLNAKAWAPPCSLSRASVSPKFFLQSGLPNGPQRTQEDPRGLKRSFQSLQFAADSWTKESWMPTACNFSAQVIVCQGPNPLLFALSNSKCIPRSLLCILSRASLVYISLVWGNSETSNLTNGRSALLRLLASHWKANKVNFLLSDVRSRQTRTKLCKT